MVRGFDFWRIMCAGSTSMCYAVARFLFALHMEDNVRSYRPVHVFDNTPLVPLLDKFTSC